MITIGKVAVDANLTLVALQGTEVAHLDGAVCELVEEFFVMVSKFLHNFLVSTQRGKQGLVAGNHALLLEQILVVVAVEFVGRREVQIRQRECQIVRWPCRVL